MGLRRTPWLGVGVGWGGRRLQPATRAASWAGLISPRAQPEVPPRLSPSLGAPTPPLVIPLLTTKPLDGTMSPAAHSDRASLHPHPPSQPTLQPHSHKPPWDFLAFSFSLRVFIKSERPLYVGFILF